MKRKKWSELEEQTLLSKYADLLNSGTLSKLKTREKKFKPIAEHVNSLHHLQDPITFRFKWCWRDVSIKVQNMRHQYLGVKQKIRINSSNEFNWVDGKIHWENFLKYKEVFGDIVLSPDFGGKDKEISDHGGHKKIAGEGISDIFGYEIESEDIEDDDEMEQREEEEEEEDRVGLEVSDEAGEEGTEGNFDLMKNVEGKSFRLIGAKVLELKDMILMREEKRRDREWCREETLTQKETSVKEREFQREKRLKLNEETMYRWDVEFGEIQMMLARRELENWELLEREFNEERRRRMKWEEKWEEEEMKWRGRMVEMQMEHEKQMMQIHVNACQNQLQVLGAMARLVCQFFGSTSDGLGGGLGTIPPQILQNLPHSGSLNDSGKPETTSPSEFL